MFKEILNYMAWAWASGDLVLSRTCKKKWKEILMPVKHHRMETRAVQHLKGTNNWLLTKINILEKTCLAVVAHTFNPSTWEAEAGRFLSLRPAWSTEWVPGQPELYRETLSWKTNKQTKEWRRVFTVSLTSEGAVKIYIFIGVGLILL